MHQKEFCDENGECTVREGDTVEAFFLSAKNNGLLFTTKISGGASAAAHLEDAHRNNIPVEGKVAKETKGGFEVTIGGNVRAFCPYSQMGLRRIENADDYIEEILSFKVIEYSENGRNIVLSHRAILEEEREEKREELKSSLEVGTMITGRITSIRNFGAFMDTGALEGLIPISEISWGRVEDIHGILSVGQEVEAEIMKLDWEADRFSFSLRKALPDPWEEIGKYSAGASLTGRVARLTKFGAFVTLEPGVDGLIHISQLGKGRKINHPREVLQEGDSVLVRIDSINSEERRISLSMPAIAGEGKSGEAEDTDNTKEYETYRTKKKETKQEQSLGTLGDLLKKKLEGK